MSKNVHAAAKSDDFPLSCCVQRYDQFAKQDPNLVCGRLGMDQILSVVQMLACDWVALIDVPFMDKCRLRTVNWTFGRAFLPFMMNDDYTKKSGEMMVEEPLEALPAYGAERDAQHTLELIGRLSDLDVRTFFFFTTGELIQLIYATYYNRAVSTAYWTK
jgi:hypothetical protein